MDDHTHDLLIRGIAAAKSHDLQEAHFYLDWLLRLDPPDYQRIDALFWLSEVTSNPMEKRRFLENMLAYDIDEPRARRGLAILDGELNPSLIIDPDRFKLTNPGLPQETETKRFTCPNCGGRLTYAPDGATLLCEYCESRQRLATNPTTPSSMEQNFITALATARGHSSPVFTQLIQCQGCGANFLLPPNEISIICPYCGSENLVVSSQAEEIIQPAGILPLEVAADKAAQNLQAWFQSNSIPTPTEITKGRAVYLPAWCFDVGGEMGWNSLTNEGQTWVPSSGEKLIQQTDIVVLATNRLHEALRNAVTGYNLKPIVVFDQRYLADCAAETYQINLAEASLRARQIVMERERQLIQESFYLPIRDLHLDTSHMQVEAFMLILLPAWLTNYTIRDELFSVFINGQSGKVIGLRPRKGLTGWLSKVLSG